MFFLMQRRDRLSLSPRYFTKGLESELLHTLRSKVEGKCSGRYGYTIAVTNLENSGQLNGYIDHDTGNAIFDIIYTCIVFRPFKNEILPAIVQNITINGLFVSAGPLNIFISEKLMPPDLVYDHNSIQPRYISNDNDNSSDSNNEQIIIEIGRYIRVKIVGIRLTQDNIVCIGSIAEDFLG